MTGTDEVEDDDVTGTLTLDDEDAAVAAVEVEDVDDGVEVIVPPYGGKCE